MGFAAGLFDDSPDEEVVFWRAWNAMPRVERRKFLKRLGRERAKLLNNREARQQLAKWVKVTVFPISKPTGRGAKGKQR